MLHNRDFYSATDFIHHGEEAKQIFFKWFSEFYRKGRDAALVLLRKELWTPEMAELEESLVKCQIHLYDEVISTLEIPASSSTFTCFPLLPVELQLQIWHHTFSPRIIEVQGNRAIGFYDRKFHACKDLNLRRFQKVAKYGMTPGISLKRFFALEDAETLALNKMQHESMPWNWDDEDGSWEGLDYEYDNTSAEERYITELAYKDGVEDREIDVGNNTAVEDLAGDETWGAAQLLEKKKFDTNVTPYNFSHKGREGVTSQFWSPTLPPAALWVNHESRLEALRFYKL